MHCIVTAGPTYEPLDQVRRLTNFSTGTLGTELANRLAAAGHRATLLKGHYSTCQIQPRSETQIFTTTADLAARLEALSASPVHAVFHAAAVSDFTFGKVWDRSVSGEMRQVSSGKFSTASGTLLAELVPTPKIIGRLRAWFPDAFLVGWKYEVDGNRESVVAKARQQIAHNRTDVCVANGPAYGEGFGVVTTTETVHLPTAADLYVCLERLLSLRQTA